MIGQPQALRKGCVVVMCIHLHCLLYNDLLVYRLLYIDIYLHITYYIICICGIFALPFLDLGKLLQSIEAAEEAWHLSAEAALKKHDQDSNALLRVYAGMARHGTAQPWSQMVFALRSMTDSE